MRMLQEELFRKESRHHVTYCMIKRINNLRYMTKIFAVIKEGGGENKKKIQEEKNKSKQNDNPLRTSGFRGS